MGGIKQPTLEKGRYVDVRHSSDISPDSLHPAFCFKHLKKNFGFPQDKKQQTAIINTLKKLSLMSWAQIKSSGKRNSGCHKIKLEKSPPIELTPDISIVAFDCAQDGRMIGYRDAKIFYVFWFDWKPFKLYDHS